MGQTLFIIVALVVLVLLDLLLDVITSARKPPRSVKIVELCEMTFGAIVVASSAYFRGVEHSRTGGLLALIIGILWWILAIAIYLGHRWARTLCIILSIIRIVTIIGIPFSVISLYITLFSKDFRDYVARGKATNWTILRRRNSQMMIMNRFWLRMVVSPGLSRSPSPP
jgi:hypothetical protein